MVREKQQDPAELGPPWTVLKLLRWTAGYFEDEEISETPRLDADLLLADVLDLDRVELYARFDTEVDDEARAAFRQLVKRRAAGEPVAYLVERKSFWQRTFHVDDRVMIPRPETEVLVEETLEVLSEQKSPRVVDVGTGSGAVVLALAAERPDLELVATDVSGDALEVGRDNAARHDVADRIDWYRGDLLEALPDEDPAPDVVVSNPPYVPADDRSELSIEIRDHEPDRALLAGPQGLDVLERLIPQAADRLADGGWLVVEIGAGQGGAVAELFDDAGFEAIEVRRDYADRDRVVRGRRPAASDQSDPGSPR